MNFSFPVFLDLEGKRVLVAGGGFMAEEKVAKLLEAGARVVVQATELTPALQDLALRKVIEHRPCPYRQGDMAGFLLVISAMSRRENEALFAEAEQRGQLFNAVDDPRNCRFIVASTHRSGNLTVAVSTNGQCPALGVRLRERLAGELGPEYGQFLELAERLRPHIGAQVGEFEKRKALWYRLVDSGALGLLREGRRNDAESLLKRILSEELVEYPVPAYS
ncbi:MAG: bifunctional precorrin-2 dehydrogenase/sirohydrochlorin ferrochelatase [Bryobacteraceae bacterium]|nr:bifunctional precorrin-2 dehydrogenase/sirohydrochlorin ferrochelatase [Bryobacteraceae bacterium]